MARLRRVVPYGSPGFTRNSAGTFVGAGKADRARAEALVIPPAWTEVWVAKHERAHIQAVGVDAAGRRQYLYHPDWRASHDRAKFRRARELAAALPAARRKVTRDLRLPGLPRERVLAAAFRVLDTAAVRAGNEEYTATNGSRGLATLQRKHARLDGESIRLTFPAKSGKKAVITVQDHDLAAFVRDLPPAKPGARLLAWGDEATPLSTAEVNAYVKQRTGGDFTAKDFRTLKAGVVSATELAHIGTADTATARGRAMRSAADAAAGVLGNTRSVALKSYIDPEIFERYEAGKVIARGAAPEAALLRLLGD